MLCIGLIVAVCCVSAQGAAAGQRLGGKHRTHHEGQSGARAALRHCCDLQCQEQHTARVLTPESRQKIIVLSKRGTLICGRGLSSGKMNGIFKYRWDLCACKVTMRKGLIPRRHFTTGLLFVTNF